jgi:hypothetical protein
MFNKKWEDMTTQEKFEWLRHEDQSTRQLIQKTSGEIAIAVDALAKRVAALEAAKK